MAEPREGIMVTRLSEEEWKRELSHATVPLPFGTASWLRWGLTSVTGNRFSPVMVHWPDAGDLLVPLCVNGEIGQIGGFGYGMVCPAQSWTGGPAPRFEELAAAICAVLGLAQLRTLLPPRSTVDLLDHLAGHWPGQKGGRTTYLLALNADAGTVWTRARGNVRTAVRRAGDHGLQAGEPRPGDGMAVARLYRETLRRNGSTSADADLDLTFLADDGRPDVVTRTVHDGGTIQAVSSFAVTTGTAFHVMQATSAAGRRSNAGHLAFWSALNALATVGVHRVDLGSAAGDGQERFKLNWGSVPRATRPLCWPQEVRNR